MSMVMVIADSRYVIRPISIDCGFIVNMVVAVLVMPEMDRKTLRVLQRSANAHRCSVSGVQRE